MAILATSTSMTEKTERQELEWVFFILYPVIFKDHTEASQDLRSTINTINQTFAFKQDLKIWKTNVDAQKIDIITLETYKIVVSNFSIPDKDNKKRFFEESVLLTDINLDILLKILFLIMTNADVDFQAEHL